STGSSGNLGFSSFMLGLRFLLVCFVSGGRARVLIFAFLLIVLLIVLVRTLIFRFRLCGSRWQRSYVPRAPVLDESDLFITELVFLENQVLCGLAQHELAVR